ncbi:thioredoxin fold domain-containing protein [Reinekea marina]|uniref:Thioredoxin family protein n=1 Tax=Reinekea marina TaxID=1310421 RepID=A0ABV7WPB7_9GAMM|nr:thioredoxin fold domain-containing protein [Reinekea marina]MDN3647782.1 thioredoxin fold domain-containing protein [Reinekea marina]
MTSITKHFCLLLFGFLISVAAFSEPLNFAPVDLPKAALHIVDQQKPLILYVAHSTCPFCKQLDKEIMPAVLNSKAYTDTVIVQKLVWDSFAPVNWIDNLPTPPDDIVTMYKVRATPTLLFLNEKGEEIAKRIEGYRGADFYWVYLDKSIEQARQQLQGT